MSSTAPIEFSPSSHELHDDPYPTYARLRVDAPLYYSERHDFWTLSRYDDIENALLEPHVFSSLRYLGDETKTRTNATSPSMITMDPPRHDELRAIVNRAFTPRRIRDLEPRIRDIARELIEAFAESGRCDLYRDFSGPLPTTVIAELLGVPVSDREWFKEKSTDIISNLVPEQVGDGGSNNSSELGVYLAGVFEEKRRKPGDDLMSALLEADIDGVKLTTVELAGFAVLLLIAGNETTTNLISNATQQLDRFPDERRRLIESPSLLKTASEEFRRYDSPVQGLERWVASDVEVRGRKLRRGARVFLLLASGNRDEQQFPEPERFDITRTPNRHLAFGFGTHFCLGASLARLEARVAWEELFARFSDFEIEGPCERLHSGIIRGLLSVPVALEGR